jgi:hypothetical protein
MLCRLKNSYIVLHLVHDAAAAVAAATTVAAAAAAVGGVPILMTVTRN